VAKVGLARREVSLRWDFDEFGAGSRGLGWWGLCREIAGDLTILDAHRTWLRDCSASPHDRATSGRTQCAPRRDASTRDPACDALPPRCSLSL
jgi:hypothetical protein